MSLHGVGLGFRPELSADLLRDPSRVDFLEVVAENALAHPAARREARAIAEIWPIALHGVKLSLGSAEGLDEERARRLGRLARELRCKVVTEHVAFTRAGGREIGHLTPLPFSREAVRVVARNVATARRHLPDVPLLLENIAWTLRPPGDEMDEAAFYTEIVEATGCDLLLDLANLYANARNRSVNDVNARYVRERADEAARSTRNRSVNDVNARYVRERADEAARSTRNRSVNDVNARYVRERADEAARSTRDAGRDPARALAAYPLDSVAMVHLAGGVLEHGFYLDTHAHPVPPPVLDLLRQLVSSHGAVPVIVERDDRFPPFEELATEVDAARAAMAGAPERGTSARRLPRADTGDAPGLSARQRRLAELLTMPASPVETAPFDREGIDRTRAVLVEKRLDEALPLLPRTGAHGCALRPIALPSIRESARAPRGTAIADARRIADAAALDPRFSGAARRDRLELRSRFVGEPDGTARPRKGPFVGHETLPDGRRVWAVKGPGAAAPVHLFPKGADR